MITERIIKENPENHEAFVYLYTKLKALPDEKQLYGGLHLGNTADGYHHSSTDDDLDLDIAKHDFKYEILHWGTLDEMKTKEHSMLKLADAAKNSEWYNKHNGAPSVVGEIDLLTLVQWADEIKETNSLFGHSAIIQTFSKKTMKAEIRKMFRKLQARHRELIQSNTRNITSWIDKYQGNLKELFKVEKINLIVVVLEGIVIDGEEVDLIVGGNHTIDGTIASKHGKEINFLRIPKSDHGLDYNQAKQFASFLNKASKQPGVNNDDDDILKTAFELCIDFKQTSQSEKIDDLFDFHECNPAQKKRLKLKLNSMLSKNALQNQMWKMYDTDQGKIDLANRVTKLQTKYPNARIFTASSAGSFVPRNLRDLYNEIEGGMTYDSVLWVVYHSNPDAMKKWFAEYLTINTSFITLNTDAMVRKFSKIKKLSHYFDYMETSATDLN